MGTELRPDVAFLDGDFAEDALPLAEPFELEERLGLPRAASRWEGWSRTADRENKRFHYRYKALAFAKAAVRLAEDADVRAWSLMLGGVAALSVNDPAEADSFYKPLAKMRHPRAKVGRWFTGPTYDWFRTTHYNKERHHKPLRVPPRMTKEQLQKMKML
jgi:hypothetical protein